MRFLGALVFCGVVLASCRTAPPEGFRPGHGFVVEPAAAPGPLPATGWDLHGRFAKGFGVEFCVGPAKALALTTEGELLALTEQGIQLALDLGRCESGDRCLAHELPPILDLSGATALVVVHSGSLGKDFRSDLLTLHPREGKILRHVLAREGAAYRAESEEFLQWSGPELDSMQEDPVQGLVLGGPSGYWRVRHRNWSGDKVSAPPLVDLSARDAEVRLRSLRALVAETDPALGAELLGMLRGDVPWVAREAALALAQRKVPEASAAALLRLREGVDPVLEAALVHVLERCGLPAGLLEDPSPLIRRAALRAGADRVTVPELVTLLDPAQPALEALARRTLQRRGLLAAAVSKVLEGRSEAAWVALSDQAEVRAALGRLLQVEPAFALGVLDRIPDGVWEPGWTAGARALLDSPDDLLLRRALAALKGRVEDRAGRIAADASRSEALRVEALAAAPQNFELPAGAFELLQRSLKEGASAFLRLSAAQALGRVRLSPAEEAELVPLLSRLSGMELERILPQFERSEQVLPKVAANPAAAGISAELVLKYGTEEQRAELARSMSERKARLEELGAQVLEGGDPRRGRELLFGARAECTACHTVRGQGGRVGPDLSRIGSLKTRSQLLEAVLFPSATFAAGFESYRVRVRDGEVYDGFLQRESPDAIVLVQGDRTERRIPKESVERIERGRISVMPQGFGERLRADDLRDLLAFLSSLR